MSGTGPDQMQPVGDDNDEASIDALMAEVAPLAVAVPLSPAEHDVYLAGLEDYQGDREADLAWFAENPNRVFRLRPGQADDLITLAFFPVEHLLFWPTFSVPVDARNAIVAWHNYSDAGLVSLMQHYFDTAEKAKREWRPQLGRLQKIMWLALAHGRLKQPPTKDALDHLLNWGWVWSERTVYQA